LNKKEILLVSNENKRKCQKTQSKYSRRDFLKISGIIVVGSSGGGLCGGEIAVIPASQGYLLVDTKKCQGCRSCMLACSLVHEGAISLSLARLQIMENSFAKWPDDIMMAQCRQCRYPACVDACPVKALTADAEFNNVRRVDPDTCIGCGKCVKACPHKPGRLLLAPDENYNNQDKSRKCDLCADAPYHYDKDGVHVEGGPGGKQACIEVCTLNAIAFTADIPSQWGDAGYNVNLRDEVWGLWGYPVD
jgi:protein NrfC